MKQILQIATVVFTLSRVLADPIHVGDTQITFEPPPGFSALPQEIIALKWPSNRAPKYAVGNDTASTTVAYDLKPHSIPQDKLTETQQVFTHMFNRLIPGIEWKKNEIEHEGQKWIYIEVTSNAVDTDIYNIMLMTGLDGKMIAFNFNSTKEDFPLYEDTLRASTRSIRINK